MPSCDFCGKWRPVTWPVSVNEEGLTQEACDLCRWLVVNQRRREERQEKGKLSRRERGKG